MQWGEMMKIKMRHKCKVYSDSSAEPGESSHIFVPE